ncbi:Fic family protein [bacterium]|nr:Fic family protein [bacterium]
MTTRPRATGRYESTTVAGESVRAVVPAALPPARPPLDLDGGLAPPLQRATTALAALEAAARMVPSVEWFVYAFVRREAVVSSQIEGTQASLVDLLAVEAQAPTTASLDQVEEICNHLEALAWARAQLARRGGLPLSVRLLNGAHRRLLAGTRGQHSHPGSLRRSQNWIGGTRPGNARFVPPPPHLVPELLGDLERYLHEDDGLPPLVRAGLVHAQFETIHPYLDGNGRVGRLLIALCLQEWGLLGQPLLYLSLFFKRHRREYYERLGAIRTDGDWEGWLSYFLEGVAEIADEAAALVGALFELQTRDRARCLATPGATVPGARLFEALAQHPFVTVKLATGLVGVTRPTAAKAIHSLVNAGILEETTGRERDRTWVWAEYLKMLREGTDLMQ